MELPADFFSIVEFRIYLDNVEEIMSLHARVSRPPDYVRCTPILFSAWQEWVEVHETEKTNTDFTLDKTSNMDIRPMGQRIAPDWMKYEFDNLEDFYKYYCDLMHIGDDNGD